MDEVNKQVVNSVLVSSERVLGDVPVQSYGISAEALAHSLALIMHNAGTTQFAGSQISDAAVVKACAAILSKAG